MKVSLNIHHQGHTRVASNFVLITGKQSIAQVQMATCRTECVVPKHNKIKLWWSDVLGLVLVPPCFSAQPIAGPLEAWRRGVGMYINVCL